MNAPVTSTVARYTVAVRALCEFTAKRGDLDLRFTPAPTAQEGIAGHATVTGRRRAGYLREVSLQGEHGPLLVRGRADGYDPWRQRLEEIKTYRGDFQRIPDNHRALHWAQARIYGWLQCQTLGLARIELALVYFNIVTQKETVLDQTCDAAELREHFEQQCGLFLAWAERELAHRAARDTALVAMAFPHAAFQHGQRELAESVYKAASTGRCLMAQAPTGIGKTIGTVFPLLKAFPGQCLDKLFFLSAKTPGRQLALNVLAQLRGPAPGLPLRVLELVARDKACEHPDKACHGESCPLAQGFYDRLAAAREAALALGFMDQEAVRAAALAHGVCPYYLSQELARWSDAVVGDYNYYFDISALLYALTVANQWRVGVLVDEAHNLLERGRAMYSADLDQAEFQILRKAAPKPVKAALDKLNRAWNALHDADGAVYRVLPAVPEAFQGALQRASAAVIDYLTEYPADSDAGLQRFYFDAMHFLRLVDTFAEHSLFDVTLRAAAGRHHRQSAQLCLRNVLPAPFLAPRFAEAHCAVLFSATLSPTHFYADTLGLPTNTAWIDVQSPFSSDQLTVRLAGHISTRYPDRARSVAPIVELICAQYRQQPGNYLAFFSSFDYLQQVLAQFASDHPDIPTWSQSRGMGEEAQRQFLARFDADGQGIGFAVLGGAFAEGIDLPGSRLIGAFVATLGLPQLNPVNEQIMQRMQTIFGAGYDYTYLYPGLQKVVQAAGRVIRTRQDRGVVYLIDDRFTRRQVRALLPDWWRVERMTG
ncbi:ATP-dependent DNA helicase [Chitiniphilus eburneus]|uniref:ATP-dependent DNA helicase n=1 Tax=Chitiniphilus eburneus TaxID=2571148 RepID=A0A4U0PYZ5_9NEIS|nr:ATP-dependent DNA helicase [Chitiniphilus eburneus]TJZ73883.1 ATP-dependent DNA helicase [Chitiniphilus eburneus]